MSAAMAAAAASSRKRSRDSAPELSSSAGRNAGRAASKATSSILPKGWTIQLACQLWRLIEVRGATLSEAAVVLQRPTTECAAVIDRIRAGDIQLPTSGRSVAAAGFSNVSQSGSAAIPTASSATTHSAARLSSEAAPTTQRAKAVAVEGIPSTRPATASAASVLAANGKYNNTPRGTTAPPISNAEFTVEEDVELLKAVAAHGTRWVVLQSMEPFTAAERSAVSLRKRFVTLQTYLTKHPSNAPLQDQLQLYHQSCRQPKKTADAAAALQQQQWASEMVLGAATSLSVEVPQPPAAEMLPPKITAAALLRHQHTVKPMSHTAKVGMLMEEPQQDFPADSLPTDLDYRGSTIDSSNAVELSAPNQQKPTAADANLDADEVMRVIHRLVQDHLEASLPPEQPVDHSESLLASESPLDSRVTNHVRHQIHREVQPVAVDDAIPAPASTQMNIDNIGEAVIETNKEAEIADPVKKRRLDAASAKMSSNTTAIPCGVLAGGWQDPSSKKKRPSAVDAAVADSVLQSSAVVMDPGAAALNWMRQFHQDPLSSPSVSTSNWDGAASPSSTTTAAAAAAASSAAANGGSSSSPTLTNIAKASTATFALAWANVECAGTLHNASWASVFEPQRCVFRSFVPRAAISTLSAFVPCMYLSGQSRQRKEQQLTAASAESVPRFDMYSIDQTPPERPCVFESLSRFHPMRLLCRIAQTDVRDCFPGLAAYVAVTPRQQLNARFAIPQESINEEAGRCRAALCAEQEDPLGAEPMAPARPRTIGGSLCPLILFKTAWKTMLWRRSLADRHDAAVV